jgi:cytidine deaminase
VALIDDDSLLHEAQRAAQAAYAPYSGFSVGAAALARDGRLFLGANVENASYGLTLCAERAALARAVSDGAGPGAIEAIAVTASPCGGCRQWLVEFGVDRVAFPLDGELIVRRASELLPDMFRLS